VLNAVPLFCRLDIDFSVPLEVHAAQKGHSRLPEVGIENNLESLRKCLQLSRAIEDVHNSNL